MDNDSIYPAGISKAASVALGAAAGTTIVGPLGGAIGGLIAGKDDILGAGGPGALLDKTRDNCRQLGRRLAGAAAWPIGIIHGGNPNPTDQHQVLATNYIDHGDNTAELDIWDNNYITSCINLRLDMRGGELTVSSKRDDLNDIKGIICENYTPLQPPALLHTSLVPGVSNWAPGSCL